MKKKTMRVINQAYMDLIEEGWRIHGICKKKRNRQNHAGKKILKLSGISHYGLLKNL